MQHSLFEDDNWLYINDVDNANRYLLGRPGKNPLICFGVNPSTAEPHNLDPTLRTLELTAARMKHDSWLMFNLYPQRATNPDDMHIEMLEKLHKRNCEVIENTLSALPPSKIWAAWGALILKRNYLSFCLKDIAEIADKYNHQWIHRGALLKGNHPHHPLYLSNSAAFSQFEMENYLQLLKIS